MTINGEEEGYDPSEPLVLESPNRYEWSTVVRHGEDQPQVRAEVRKSPETGGQRHGKPYCHEPEGNAGDESFVTLVALTRLED